MTRFEYQVTFEYQVACICLVILLLACTATALYIGYTIGWDRSARFHKVCWHVSTYSDHRSIEWSSPEDCKP